MDSDNCFDIDTVEGTISTIDYVDRETAPLHNITVLATKVSEYSTERTRLSRDVLNTMPQRILNLSATSILSQCISVSSDGFLSPCRHLAFASNSSNF